MNEAPFELTPADKHSPTWMRLKEHLNARLQTLRIQNDAEATPEQTANRRGRIAEIKFLLTLDDSSPTQP